jgi:hypothetical protein
VRPRTAALLVVPFLVVGVALQVAVPAWGDSIARRIARVAALFKPSPPRVANVSAPPVASVAASEPPLLVHVPARAVQFAIDDEGVHVRARPAFGLDGAPAGVRLTGISSLDAGVKDGDVLVAVEGEPALDEAAAAALALTAVARGASAVHATLLRGDQPVLVTADWPAVAPLSPAPAGSPAGKAR